MLAIHPTMHKRALTTKIYLAQNVGIAKVEKRCSGVSSSFMELAQNRSDYTVCPLHFLIYLLFFFRLGLFSYTSKICFLYLRILPWRERRDSVFATSVWALVQLLLVAPNSRGQRGKYANWALGIISPEYCITFKRGM